MDDGVSLKCFCGSEYWVLVPACIFRVSVLECWPFIYACWVFLWLHFECFVFLHVDRILSVSRLKMLYFFSLSHSVVTRFCNCPSVSLFTSSYPPQDISRLEVRSGHMCERRVIGVCIFECAWKIGLAFFVSDEIITGCLMPVSDFRTKFSRVTRLVSWAEM
jgi:hypothetical protein